MNPVRIFTSYDVDHDADLHDLLLAQFHGDQVPHFEISARSRGGDPTPDWEAKVRRRMQRVDEVVVLCGEHTRFSARMSRELCIAREEGKPYLLVWGRRECMCTKPAGTRRDEGIYRWTRDALKEQLLTTLRRARPLRVADRYRKGP